MTAKATKRPAARPPASDYYQVDLARSWPDAGFVYKPGHSNRVDADTLARMQAEPGLVINVRPAD